MRLQPKVLEKFPPEDLALVIEKPEEQTLEKPNRDKAPELLPQTAPSESELELSQEEDELPQALAPEAPLQRIPAREVAEAKPKAKAESKAPPRKVTVEPLPVPVPKVSVVPAERQVFSPEVKRKDGSTTSASTTASGDSRFLASPSASDARSPISPAEDRSKLRQQLEELEEQQKQIQTGLKEALDYHRRLWADELNRCRMASQQLEKALDQERRQHAEQIKDWEHRLQQELQKKEAQWREEERRTVRSPLGPRGATFLPWRAFCCLTSYSRMIRLLLIALYAKAENASSPMIRRNEDLRQNLQSLQSFRINADASLASLDNLQQLRPRKERRSHTLQPAMAELESTGARGAGNGSVANRRKIPLDSTAVAQSKRFAEELIAQERQTLCPGLPSQVNLEILAANAKVAEELIYVFRAKLSTRSHHIPNQAVEILRTGIEVEWLQNAAFSTNDEQSAFGRAEDELRAENGNSEPLTRGAKLVLPLAACDLMNSTFFLMCNRKARAASLLQDGQTSEAIQRLRESYLTLPYGMGVLIDKEQEAYRQGLKRVEKVSLKLSYPESFSWLYERPQCLDYVHHQGTCGACYMFAALDSLSDRHCIDTSNASRLGKVEHLSVQMALLCEPLGRQCSGGWADVGFNYSVYYGIQPASLWPYERSCLSDSECQFGKQCFSPSSYACPGFFSQEELNEVVTFSDALRVTKRKCETSNFADPDNCKVWAEMMFAFSPTMVFMPERCFCDELKTDWARFQRSEAPRGHKDGSGMPMVLQESRAVGATNEEGFNFFSWLYGLFAGHEETTVEVEETWNKEIPGGGWGEGSTDESTSTSTSKEECDRDRCTTEPQPHKASKYHYILNRKEDFKREIYNDGPFYTSFFVYEDFTWFFTYWPEHAYNYQWGALQGGHAVVLIGWESSCIYHGEKLGIPTENAPVRQKSSNSETFHGECWHLRNTWGDEWGDKGYFRFADDMLTGPEGYHIHIASAAADGPKSVLTTV